MNAAPDHRTASNERREALRARIIDAAFAVLMDKGYAGAGTREIARRARVSKRDLYALFGSKRGIIAAMIAGRAVRMRLPLGSAGVENRAGLSRALARFGTALAQEVCRPEVMALFRLAIVEAESSPELARALDESGRQPNRAALTAFLAAAQARGLVAGAPPETMASQLLALLWDDLLLRMLLRQAEAPSPGEIERRAAAAASAVLALYAVPKSSPA